MLQSREDGLRVRDGEVGGPKEEEDVKEERRCSLGRPLSTPPELLVVRRFLPALGSFSRPHTTDSTPLRLFDKEGHEAREMSLAKQEGMKGPRRSSRGCGSAAGKEGEGSEWGWGWTHQAP